MTAAISKTPESTVPQWSAWSSLLMPGIYAIGSYWLMHKYKGMEAMMKEIEEIRACRDAALATAAQAFKLVECLVAGEKLLREKLATAEAALKKERDESMEKFGADFKERQKLEARISTLEKENTKLEVPAHELRTMELLVNVPVKASGAKPKTKSRLR